MNKHTRRRSNETITDRIRALAALRASQESPLRYEELPAICEGTRTPSSTDLAYIADEAGVRIESLLGIRGLARLRRTVRLRLGRIYWGLWRGIRPSPFQAKLRMLARAAYRRG
ncbi:hypothetical protein [Streptomyces sp. NPDC101455]|uniref:hypothetical protein n=1 Tax=Streptomyces sp. NPDC101455 TaxID=3366142 RepID=UPI0037F2C914